jgi:hypothetical protein
MAEFFVTNVPSTGFTDDGENIMVRLENEVGETIDIAAHYVDFEDIVTALNEASDKAISKRRELRKVDEPLVRKGDVPDQILKSFRYAVAADKTHMMLQIQTSTSRINIVIPKADAKASRDATERNFEALMAPPKSEFN